MATNKSKGLVPLSPEEQLLEQEQEKANEPKAAPVQKKTLQYIGPKYKGLIVLPHFTRPSDPRKWTEATIQTYLWKWPDLSRYFGYK